MRYGTGAPNRLISPSQHPREKANGYSPLRTTASESILSTRSRSLESSSVFTAVQSIPARGWDWLFAGVLSIASAAESGWNPQLGGVQRFSLQSPAPEP